MSQNSQGYSSSSAGYPHNIHSSSQNTMSQGGADAYAAAFGYGPSSGAVTYADRSTSWASVAAGNVNATTATPTYAAGSIPVRVRPVAVATTAAPPERAGATSTAYRSGAIPISSSRMDAPAVSYAPGTSAPPPPTQPQPPKSDKVVFPPDLTALVQRAFAWCAEDEKKKDAVEQELRILFSEAQQDNTFYTRDWSKVTLKTMARAQTVKYGVREFIEEEKMKKRHLTEANNEVSLAPQPSVAQLEAREARGRSKRGLQASHSQPQPDDGGRRVVPLQISAPSFTYRGDSSLFFDAIRKRSGKFLAVESTDSLVELGCGDEAELQQLTSMTVRGTCTLLEKRYLRLTSAPDPSTVRTRQTLERALKFVTDKYSNDGIYEYTCEQMKSLRQDLVVQRINDEFTVQVYETHAKIAIERYDISEFNQCATQLLMLYERGLGTKSVWLEFAGYCVLYQVLVDNVPALSSAVVRFRRNGIYTVGSKSPISHALEVASSVSMNDYVKFYSLYRTASRLARCFMDLMLPNLRLNTLKSLVKSHRPDLLLSHAARCLAFSLDEAMLWTRHECGCVFVDPVTGHTYGDPEIKSLKNLPRLNLEKKVLERLCIDTKLSQSNVLGAKLSHDVMHVAMDAAMTE